jgi:hypothetical protein
MGFMWFGLGFCINALSGVFLPLYNNWLGFFSLWNCYRELVLIVIVSVNLGLIVCGFGTLLFPSHNCGLSKNWVTRCGSVIVMGGRIPLDTRRANQPKLKKFWHFFWLSICGFNIFPLEKIFLFVSGEYLHWENSEFYTWKSISKCVCVLYDTDLTASGLL